MNKLICTPFVYTADVYNGRKTEMGSYLGRKAASMRTIRRFLRETVKATGAEFALVSVSLCTPYVSQWMAK